VPHFPLIPHFLSRWLKTTLTCYTSPAIFTYIYKKLRFWKRRRNDAVTNSNIAMTTYNFTSETGTQVSSIEMILSCNIGTKGSLSLNNAEATRTLCSFLPLTLPSPHPKNHASWILTDKQCTRLHTNPAGPQPQHLCKY